MLGVRPNGDAAGAQRLHDGGVRSAVRGITVESLEIETDGEIDLRGFLGIDATVPPGYENLSYIVRIKGNGRVRRDPRGGDGDLAQLLQRIPRAPDVLVGRYIPADVRQS